MSMFDEYLDYVNLTYKNPNGIMRELQQEIVNKTWEETTLLETVQEEISHGELVFNPLEVWKNSVSEFYTAIIKNEKDYRRLMFKDQTHIVERGRYYNFEDNYYIVYDPTSDIEPFCEVLVRRCNNIARWIDKNTNVLHEIPCVLDYEASSPKPRIDGDIITPSNGTVLIIQGNEYTRNLLVNQRLIFNGRPYKITGYNNYMQDDYFGNDVNILAFDIYLDEIQSSDDLVNGIANKYEYDYQINIVENPTENIKGFSGKLNAQVTLNNNVVDVPIVWSSNQYGTIDNNGVYTLVGDSPNVATFTASFGRISTSVNINIVDTIIDNYEIIITPNITEIKQNRSVTINANLYKNGIKQNDIVNATVVGADSPNCYNWVSQGNNVFILTNKLRSVKPLVITFTSGVITKSISIELNAMY